MVTSFLLFIVLILLQLICCNKYFLDHLFLTLDVIIKILFFDSFKNNSPYGDNLISIMG